MANCIIRHIPNTVTCCNLFCGCLATFAAIQANYSSAFFLIILAAVFDFFDGMLARLLHAYSTIGKELDSLADNVSFGVAPAFIIFSLFKEVQTPTFLIPFEAYIPYTAFLIAAFSALRLAKFNLDTRQTTSFIGVPTPANAMFWASLVVGKHEFLISEHFNTCYLLILVLLTSWLLVAEIPMFSLKFKNLSWKENKIRFLFLLVCIPLIVFLGISSFAAIIIWYVLLSLITKHKN